MAVAVVVTSCELLWVDGVYHCLMQRVSIFIKLMWYPEHDRIPVVVTAMLDLLLFHLECISLRVK